MGKGSDTDCASGLNIGPLPFVAKLAVFSATGTPVQDNRSSRGLLAVRGALEATYPRTARSC